MVRPELPVKLFSNSEHDFIIIAHRGASAYHPENTMAAFEAAAAMGADMVELDITLSHDGVPVVIHDETLDRTTNGTGMVSDHSLNELKQLDAGTWFGEKFAGERIPTLKEVLKFAQNHIALNIEIKPEAVHEYVQGGIEEKALKLVKKYGMEQHVLFSSFSYRAVENIKQLDVDIAAALLYEKKQSSSRQPVQLVADHQADAFNCSRRQYSKKWARELNRQGIPVFVYTVNKQRQMKKVIERGATGIFSDKPDVLKELVDNMWKRKDS